ncbi:hemicentin-2-like isoform X1 [Anguilla anguilla]|uniref:hemicentin-2-like isoform X1 n=1 Tax=Anguilla anguilla TaxID=7936 RepID=UPI0015ADCC30|nr:hemicentin-2-like isoform X1 [Anguilla anguilla]
MEREYLKLTVFLSALCAASGEGCSLELRPSRVVVGFGDPVSVSCVASRPVRVLGWEAAIGSAHTQSDLTVRWGVDSLKDWIEEPICYGVFFTAPRQCEEKLNLVLYKIPDSVSISAVNHTGPMTDGQQYQLQCEVQNIAPVQYLTLRWYRGQTEVYNHTFSDLTPDTPVQVSSTLLVTPTSADDGAQYSCVAELELGPEGPQPPPEVKSEPLNITVHYSPVFYSPDDETLEVTEGEGVPLNCSAQGNPFPVYSWSSPLNQEEKTSQTQITSTSLTPGAHSYTCTASNQLGQQSKKFTVKILSKGV